MNIKLDIKEPETFKMLKQRYPDIRNKNKSNVIKEAIDWLYEVDVEKEEEQPHHVYSGKDYDEFIEYVEYDDMKPAMEWRITDDDRFQIRAKHRNRRTCRLKEWRDWKWIYDSIGYWDELYACERLTKVPDGIRIIKMELKDEEMWRHTEEGWRKRDYIIQFWEIENTFQVTQNKLDSYAFWMAYDLDPHEYGSVEVWRCDKWAGGHRMLWTSVGEWTHKKYDSYEDYDRLYNYQQPRF